MVREQLATARRLRRGSRFSLQRIAIQLCEVKGGKGGGQYIQMRRKMHMDKPPSLRPEKPSSHPMPKYRPCHAETTG